MSNAKGIVVQAVTAQALLPQAFDAVLPFIFVSFL
jgi:hypothetical protein